MKKIKHVIVKEFDYKGIFVCSFFVAVAVLFLSVFCALIPFMVGLSQIFDNWIINWIITFAGLSTFIVSEFYFSYKFRLDIDNFEDEHVEHKIIARDKHG